MLQKTRPKATRPKRRRFRLERLILPAVLLASALAVGFTLTDQRSRMQSLKEEETVLQARVEDLESERARLEHMIDYAGTDSYAEQIARSVLGWVKEGETRYVFGE